MDILYKKIDCLELSTRALKRLKAIGIEYIGELVQCDRVGLATRTVGIAKITFNEIESILGEHGLTFNMEGPNFIRPDEKREQQKAEMNNPCLRIGYARVSTDDQHLHLQLDALGQARCSTIYEETASGKSAHRPELGNCLKALRAGDTLVIWRLDRLGRSLSDLVKIVMELEQRGVGLESLTERIDTQSATGKLVFHIFAALAEFERNLIRERTRAGLEAAKSRGRKGGRRAKLDSKQIKEIEILQNSGSSASDLAARYGVSRATIYNCLNRLGK